MTIRLAAALVLLLPAQLHAQTGAPRRTTPAWQPWPPAAATVFDAKPRTPPRVVPPLSSMAAPGIRMGGSVTKRLGTRSGASFAQRIGGGSNRSVPPEGDPRDRLESKRASYDRPY